MRKDLRFRLRSFVDKIISMEDGYQLTQIHHLDFTDDGDIVLELLLGNGQDSMLELVRINIKTGEAAPVHKTFKNDRLWFIGIKEGQYLYVADGKTLYIRSAGSGPAWRSSG
jgi:mannose-6-phosphate isomerase-like protein (cupin superfamily)